MLQNHESLKNKLGMRMRYVLKIFAIFQLSLLPVLFTSSICQAQDLAIEPNESGYEANGFVARLKDRAYSILDEADVTLTSSASERLEEYIEIGADRLNSDEPDRAFQRVSEFARKLVSLAEEEEDEDQRLVELSDVESICPLYPFC